MEGMTLEHVAIREPAEEGGDGMQELNDVQLAYIGGGIADVVGG